MDRLELPRSGDWEVDIVDVQGVEIEDDPYLGLLVVVERPTGLVRMAAPLSQESEILGELINAATEPPEPMLASAPPVIWARQSLLPKLAPGPRSCLELASEPPTRLPGSTSSSPRCKPI